MDLSIALRPTPLPYPETPSVAEWHAAHAPQEQAAQAQAVSTAGEQQQ